MPPKDYMERQRRREQRERDQAVAQEQAMKEAARCIARSHGVLPTPSILAAIETALQTTVVVADL
jgi:predicted alternative tryptophan synthase beta-subunit